MNKEVIATGIAKKPVIVETSPLLRSWSPEQSLAHIERLSIWGEPVRVEQKFGGLQNRTYFVTGDSGKRFAVRIGFDQLRTRQTSVVQCTIAAHKLGIGPALVYAEPGLTVVEFVDGPSMQFEQVKDPEMIKRVIDTMKIMHEGGHTVEETISYWWPFHSIRRSLRVMEEGRAATGNNASERAHEVPRFIEIVNRLEKVIGPYIPKFTHNDMVFVNMMLDGQGKVQFIDWDGGGFGHPLWDLGEFLMWIEANDEISKYALTCYYGNLTDEEMQRRLREIHAFQVAAALRLYTECIEADLDPYFFLTPEEVEKGMKTVLPGETPSFLGLADMLRPRFEEMWHAYENEF